MVLAIPVVGQVVSFYEIYDRDVSCLGYEYDIHDVEAALVALEGVSVDDLSHRGRSCGSRCSRTLWWHWACD